MALWSDNISERSLEIDDKVGRFITIVGIPSAFLLHGYVGFIFGSVKANPWWSTTLMPVVFLFSAMVSGIALVMLVYMVASWRRGTPIDMRCLDTIARYLLYAFIIDFALEMLDLVHRIYEADESFKSLDFMVHTQLYVPHIVIQIVLGTCLPIALLGLAQLVRLRERLRKGLYVDGRRAHVDRHLRHALERRHRRSTLLQELPGLHHLQAGVRDPGRPAAAIVILILPFCSGSW